MLEDFSQAISKMILMMLKKLLSSGRLYITSNKTEVAGNLTWSHSASTSGEYKFFLCSVFR